MKTLTALQAVDSYRNSSLLFSRALCRSPYGTRLGGVAHLSINKVIHRNNSAAKSSFKNKDLEAFSVNLAKSCRCVVGVGAIQRVSAQSEGFKKTSAEAIKLAERAQTAPAFDSSRNRSEKRSEFDPESGVSSKEFHAEALLMHKNSDPAFEHASQRCESTHQSPDGLKSLIHMDFPHLPILEAHSEKPMPARLRRHSTKSINKVIPRNRGQAVSPHGSDQNSLVFQLWTSPPAPFLEVT
jgi:hypothetical protein